MPADPKWIESWIEEHGPYLYHTPGNPTKRLAVAQKIMAKGLLPWNQGPGADHTDVWTPRPDHVYMGTLQALLEICEGDFEIAIQIDLRILDPARLNPDEDAFWSPQPPSKRLWEEDMGLECPAQTVKDDSYPEAELAECEAPPYEERPYETYGQWAEANKLGSNPDHTKLSLTECGTIAHHGSIPVSALALINLVNDTRECEALAA